MALGQDDVTAYPAILAKKISKNLSFLKVIYLTRSYQIFKDSTNKIENVFDFFQF